MFSITMISQVTVLQQGSSKVRAHVGFRLRMSCERKQGTWPSPESMWESVDTGRYNSRRPLMEQRRTHTFLIPLLVLTLMTG